MDDENLTKSTEISDAEISCAESRMPLGVLPLEEEPLAQRTVDQVVWALLFLGLAVRVVRYALCFPIWQDEAYLAMNYLDRGYLGLTGALDCHQVCPLFFLWAQYTSVKLLGFSVGALRLVPFLCGVAGLFLFRHLAARVLQGTAFLFAVGIFAVAYPLIRYSCEAKPYNCDMFFSLVMLTLALEWWRSRDTRWLWALTAVVPFALGFSFSCAFAGGGISLAVGLGLIVERDRKGWAAWIFYNAVLLGSFALLYAISARHQAAGELQWMQDYWRFVFPPLGSPLEFAKWLVVVHTSEMVQYPLGGARGASALTAVCCTAALFFLWRRRQCMLAVFCLAPLAPNMVAALIHRYPYGGHVRFALYLAPAVCLLAGLGAAALLVRRGKSGKKQGRPAVIVVVALFVIIAGVSIVRDFAFPYRTTSVRQHRDFARWFWPVSQRDALVICWETDIEEGRDSPARLAPAAALYLCNREIYSRRSIADSAAGKNGLLRCVRFESFTPGKKRSIFGSPTDDRVFAAWLKKTQANYKLVSRQTYTLPMSTSRGRDAPPEWIDEVTMFEFASRGE
ncbi:MAG: glycosyltransferase family 39 protein [Pirellulales bacterium]|nr:glycosyltransferase family 39 protein [Pirellulales bacterium]